jgi:hypothetical protein
VLNKHISGFAYEFNDFPLTYPDFSLYEPISFRVKIRIFMETLYPMNKKQMKEKIIRLMEDQDEERAFDGLYFTAMTYGELDSDLLDKATPAQVRRLNEVIQRLEDRDLLPDDEEMVRVRRLISNYFATSEKEYSPNVVEEPAGRYRTSGRDILDDLTPWQLERLRISMEQARNGEVYTHEEVQQKVKEWLAK